MIRYLMIATLLCIGLYARNAQARPDCSDWSSKSFFESATAADVKRCLAAGADIEARTYYAWVPLRVAEQCGSTRIFMSGDLKTEDNWTPLHVAAVHGHAETIAALIESGADMQARTRDGFTPLHLAARYGTAETVATLVKAGTDTKITQVIPFFRPVAAFFGAGAKVNGRDKYGRTPLHEAARYGTAEAVTALVKAGAKVNAREEKYGQTPLHRAAWKGTAGTVAALIEAGADIRAKGNDGNLPADLAGDNCKDPDIFRVLNAARYR